MPNSKKPEMGAGEFGLIRGLLDKCRSPVDPKVLGPGDDCSAYPLLEGSQGYHVHTIDSLIEERHFSLRYFQASDIGWKAVAVSLSDIAAMGAKPLGILLSLTVRAGLDGEFFQELYRGVEECCRSYDCYVWGGNTAFGNELSLASVAIGQTDTAPLLRSAAAVGEDIWVSGSLGCSGAGLRILSEQASESGNTVERGEMIEQAVANHLRPAPRVELGWYLRTHGLASSAIDVSDGLLQDAGHLASSSGVGICLNESEIPVHKAVADAGQTIAQAITAGEDYELLFSAPASKRSALEELCVSGVEGTVFPKLSRIGTVEKINAENHRQRVCLKVGESSYSLEHYLQANGLNKQGFQHF